MKSYLNLSVGDQVHFGSGTAVYEVACFKAFPHGIMVGIYDEPPGKHIDFLNYASLKKVEEPEPEDQPGDGEEYEWISAIVDCGEVRWEYKVKGNQMPGKQDHDEGVEDWTDEEIIDLTMRVLAVPEHQRSLIQVDFE